MSDRKRDNNADRKITYDAGSPYSIDEILSLSQMVHIERMNKHRYFMNINGETFYIKTAGKNPKGPGIVLVRQEESHNV